MDIPPVLMQLLQLGAPVGECLAQSQAADTASAESGGQPFALVLAHETASKLAEASGRPVLVLPGGMLVLEFELGAVPPGGVVVSPLASRTAYTVVGPGDASTPESDPSEEEAGTAESSAWLQFPGPGPLKSSSTLAGHPEACADDVAEAGAVAKPLRSQAAYRLAGDSGEVVRTQGQVLPLAGAAECATTDEPSGVVVQRVPPVAHSPDSPDQGASEGVRIAGEPHGVTISEEQLALRQQATAAVFKAAAKQTVGDVPPTGTQGVVSEVAPVDSLARAPNGAATEVQASVQNEDALAPVVRVEPASTRLVSERAQAHLVRESVGVLTPGGVKFETQAFAAEPSLAGERSPYLVQDIPPKHTEGFVEHFVSVDAEDPGAPLVGTESAEDGWPSGFGRSHGDEQPEASEMRAHFAMLDKGAPGAGKSESMPEATRGASSERPPGLESAVQPFESPASVPVSRAAGAEAAQSMPRGAAFQEAMTQVAVRSVRYLVSEGEQTLRVRLVPESLGEVRVEIISTRNELHLRLMSGNPAVREALEHGSDGLRNALVRDGVNLVRVTVSADGGSHENHANLSGRGAWSDGHHTPRHAPAPHGSHVYGATALEKLPDRFAYHEGSLSVYA